MEPPAATTTGIYCQACGYDLRASQEAGRCPECGRAFSPGDSTTFRTRALVPWTRTLGRRARRLALLLLVLGLLLGAPWGWYYRGWRQEQAVLDRLGTSKILMVGRAGRHVPGSFVLDRVYALALTGTPTEADMLLLPKLPELNTLRMYGPGITDAVLVHLPPHGKLADLNLGDTPITDLRPVARLPALRRLELGRTRVTDAGLVPLETLTELEQLQLWDTAITDAGLVHLEKLRALERLNLIGTQVTPAGVARLRAALPDCRISGP